MLTNYLEESDRAQNDLVKAGETARERMENRQRRDYAIAHDLSLDDLTQAIIDAHKTDHDERSFTHVATPAVRRTTRGTKVCTFIN